MKKLIILLTLLLSSCGASEPPEEKFSRYITKYQEASSFTIVSLVEDPAPYPLVYASLYEFDGDKSHLLTVSNYNEEREFKYYTEGYVEYHSDTDKSSMYSSIDGSSYTYSELDGNTVKEAKDQLVLNNLLNNLQYEYKDGLYHFQDYQIDYSGMIVSFTNITMLLEVESIIIRYTSTNDNMTIHYLDTYCRFNSSPITIPTI